MLQEESVSGDTISGYDRTVETHQEVASVVAGRRADVGVSTASVAAIYSLDFVPLRQVRYDLALLEDSLQQEPVQQLLSTLQHRWVRSQLSVLGGFDTTHTGEITRIG